MLYDKGVFEPSPDIAIVTGGSLTVEEDTPLEADTLYLVNNGDVPDNSLQSSLLNHAPNSTANAANILFAVSEYKWYFFTPLHDVRVADIRHSDPEARMVIREYDAAVRAQSTSKNYGYQHGDQWKDVDSDRLVAGRGYILQCDANGYVTMPATVEGVSRLFTTTAITTPLQTIESDYAGNSHWNYVGNPYPCYFDVRYLDFTAPITIWDNDMNYDYSTGRYQGGYRAISLVDDDYVLAPMQPFFVQKPDGVDELVFHPQGRQVTQEVRTTGRIKARLPKREDRSLFDIVIVGNGQTDRTRVVLNEESTLAYETQCDAALFTSPYPDATQLYTLDASFGRYAINERPMADGLVPLGLTIGRKGSYTLSATRADGNIYLLDKEKGLTVNLKDGPYTFEAAEGETGDRFVLRLSGNQPTSILAAKPETDIAVSAGTGQIVVSGAAGKEVRVYTLSGAQQAIVSHVSAQKTIEVPAGAYVVKVAGASHKTIVR